MSMGTEYEIKNHNNDASRYHNLYQCLGLHLFPPLLFWLAGAPSKVHLTGRRTSTKNARHLASIMSSRHSLYLQDAGFR
jgi:hypothetical protein